MESKTIVVVGLALAAGVSAPGRRAAAAQEPVAATAPAPRLPVVTWQQAIDRALARNPSVVVARLEIARADALVREVRASWLPTFTGNGSLLHVDGVRRLNGAVVQPQNQWNGNLSLNVPLLAPTSWMNDAHAQDNRAVAQLSSADVRRQVAASVGRAYLAILLQHRQVEISDRARAAAQVHYDYAHTRLLGGLGNAVDDARAEQELRTDEAQAAAARANLVRAQSALAILLSADQPVDASDNVELDTLVHPDGDAGVQGVVDRARQERTDVQVLQGKLTAAEHLRRDRWVYYAPTLSAVAQAFTQTETPLARPHGWQAQLVLSIPLYDGGFRYGVGRERKALEDEARTQWEASLRQTSVEVRTAFEALRFADQTLAAARAAAKAAITAAQLADQAYRAGATTNLEVVDAERRARDASTQAALAEDAARQARLDLLLASGKFPDR